MSAKKSIGWTDRTLNPIKGRCKKNCWYCWVRGFEKREFLGTKIEFRPDVFSTLPKKAKKVFLCSTHDLFGSWIPRKWRDVIFEAIQTNPQHTFQILTKMPENIDRPMPDNVWLGVSITGNSREDFKRASILGLFKRRAKIQFVSYEPLLEEPVQGIPNVDWIIIGRLAGYGHKFDPKRGWIKKIVEDCLFSEIPIFLKDNLKDIWGEPLIQEFPE